jgi:cleavage and polyadenylation specificity factor subunit 2
LLSHGDLAHSGLYAYAFSRWNLKAPTYTTLPVQAMARIAATEDVEGIRDEEDVQDDEEKHEEVVPSEEAEEAETAADKAMSNIPPVSSKPKRKYIATLHEVHEAFDSINVLRYSQPCHLQGLKQNNISLHNT